MLKWSSRTGVSPGGAEGLLAAGFWVSPLPSTKTIVPASFRALALICGHRRSFHSVLFASSRSRALRVGFGGLQRIRRNSRQTSEELACLARVSVTRRPARGNVHRSLS